jgi:hypothetical protein
VFRHRGQFQSLDTIRALTCGAPFSWSNIISSIRPADLSYMGIYENQDGERSAVGHITKSPKLSTAQINFLLVPPNSRQEDLVFLMEALVKEAGAWGAKQIMAEISPEAAYFPEFRRAGFVVFSKQRIYRFAPPYTFQSGVNVHWQTWTSDDIPAVRTLHQTLVPPLIQPIEPLTRLESLGLVCYDEKGELQAFADLVYGPVGVWVLPFVHPQSPLEPTGMLQQLVLDLPDLNGRPVYLVSRSYQPWIDSALESSPAEQGSEQALLVRYIALRQRVTAGLTFSQLENGNAEPTYPVTSITGNKGSG